MRLSGEDGLSASPTNTSQATEMRQTKSAFVDPLITRPSVYYGDGPFDPPSSDDEDDLVMRGESDSDAESATLLDANRSGPSTPGRAERGEPNPRRNPDVEKVRLEGYSLDGHVFEVLNLVLRNTLLFACLQSS